MLQIDEQLSTRIQKAIAFCIQNVEPSELQSLDRMILDREQYLKRKIYYHFLKKSLAASFTGSPDPLELLDGSEYENYKEPVSLHSYCYQLLWILLGQGDKYIKEAMAEFDWHIENRLQIWLMFLEEDMLESFTILASDYYETESTKSQQKKLKLAAKVLIDEEVSRQEIESALPKGCKKTKLLRDERFFPFPDFKDFCIFKSVTLVCVGILYKNRKKLHAWSAWVEAQEKLRLKQLDNAGKVLLTNGYIQKYPGRGKKKSS